MNRHLVTTGLFAVSLFANQAIAQTVTFDQVLQRVVGHYPSIRAAALQVERASQEADKIESQLGWQLKGSGGVARNVSLFGSPSERVDIAAGLSRKIDTGASLSLDAAVSREDADAPFTPATPDPSTTATLDLSYRYPLGKGAGNPGYSEGLVAAQAGVTTARADQGALLDRLAGQLIDLYMAAATTRARIANLDKAIDRTRRLKRYITDRTELGLAEKKDILQVEAQLSSRYASLRGLDMAWQQQKISIFKLSGEEWDQELEPQTLRAVDLPDVSFENLLDQIYSRSPELQKVDASLQVAQSRIRSRRDAAKDDLDLVLFAGGNRNFGDAASGSVDNSELVGGIRVEFARGLDQRGDRAGLYQAQLEQDAALEQKAQVMEELRYDLASLLAEISSGKEALKAYRASVAREESKLSEAEQRYRAGRTDTDQLIQFESQLADAELALELQYIELARRYRKLNLLRGEMWKDIYIREFEPQAIRVSP